VTATLRVLIADEPRHCSAPGFEPKTVRNHVTNILGKLQVADRAEAIIRARDAGLSVDRL
jgi:hypothetical protein